MARRTFQIDKKKCIVCGTCELECRVGATYLDDDIKFTVNREKCVGCSKCAGICPVDAIAPNAEE